MIPSHYPSLIEGSRRIPKQTREPPEYLFGYGSIIHRNGPRSDAATTLAVPARLTGFRRGWYLSAPLLGDTGLAAVPDNDGTMNGVLTHVDPSAVDDITAWEQQFGYRRLPINFESLQLDPENRVSKGTVWIYTIDEPMQLNQEWPIMQSYLDVVIAGCLEINDEFAREFVRTTFGWEHFWFNDRDSPSYPHALSVDNDRIDQLLEDLIPDAFHNRRPA